MKKTLATLMLGLMLTIGGSIVCAGPLKDGIVAYQSGDYAYRDVPVPGRQKRA